MSLIVRLQDALLCRHPRTVPRPRPGAMRTRHGAAAGGAEPEPTVAAPHVCPVHRYVPWAGDEMQEAKSKETRRASRGGHGGRTREDATPRPGRVALWVLGAAALLSLGGVLFSLYRSTGMADGLDDTGMMLLATEPVQPHHRQRLRRRGRRRHHPEIVKGPKKAPRCSAARPGLVAASPATRLQRRLLDRAHPRARPVRLGRSSAASSALPETRVTSSPGLGRLLLLLAPCSRAACRGGHPQ